MNKVKVGPDLVDLLRLAYKANRPVILVGDTGVGKSECLAAAANEMKIQHRVIDLSLLEAPDLTGLPVITKDNRTSFAPPTLLPKDGRGLIVFEELNRAPRYTQAPCLQLLTTRRLNDSYVMPEGWMPVAAINPDNDEYMVEPLDPALMARFITVEVVPDAKTWAKWAKENNHHPAIIDYVRNTKGIFNGQNSSPRAWTYVDHLLKADVGLEVRKKILQAAISGLVGPAHTKALLDRLRARGEGLPSVERILEWSSQTQDAIKTIVKEADRWTVEALCEQIVIFLGEEDFQPIIRGKRRILQEFSRMLPAEQQERLEQSAAWPSQ